MSTDRVSPHARRGRIPNGVLSLAHLPCLEALRMTVTIREHLPEDRAEAPASYRLIDCDVHPVIPDGINSLAPYLSRSWQKRFELKGVSLSNAASRLTPRYAHPAGHIIRPDASSPEGATGGSDPEFVKEDLLDRYGIDVAILNNLQAGALAASLAGPDESIALCAAFNDYFVDRWLPVSDRYRYAMSVPSQDPNAAANEIRRLASTKGVTAIALPLINILIGNRYYYPVYDAAEAAGLPILLHVTGTDLIYQGAPIATGWPESYVERYVNLSQVGAANLSSLLFSGTLDRYPRLKFIFVEYGFSWVLPLMWRMDKAWAELRLETPWLHRPPSDYIRERVRFTTQPLDEPKDPKQLYALMDMLGHGTLLFSTDYPHWDNDTPGLVLQSLPQDAKQQIYWANAASAFRL